MTDLVEVWVRTRHPEHYRLVNVADGTEWVIRDGAWVAVTEAKRDRDRAVITTVLREWVEDCVEVAEGGEATMMNVEVSLRTWLLFTEREALPRSKALMREVLREELVAAGARWRGKAHRFDGVRLV
jgi:hypothetical protein